MPRASLPGDLPRMFLARLALVVLPVLGVAIVAGFVVVALRWREIPGREARALAGAMVQGLALNGAHARGDHDDARLEPLARAALALPGVRSVLFTDADGRILASAGERVPESEVAAASRAAMTSRPVDEGQGEVLQVAAPLRALLGPTGAVVLRVDLGPCREAERRAWFVALVGGGLVAVLAGLLTLVILRALVAPARDLAQAALGLAQGDLAARVPMPPPHEIGRMGEALNHMAGRLAERREGEEGAARRLEERIRALRNADPEAGLSGDDGELERLEEGMARLAGMLHSSREAELAMQRDAEANRATLQVARERLLEQECTQGDFLDIVSHELRTPLTSIKAFAEVLLEAAPQDPPQVRAQQREFLEIIDQEAERLTRLIGDLLDLSRAGEDAVPWRMVRLPADMVVEGAVRSCRAFADRKGVTLETRWPRDVVVRGDRDRLLQMLTSLLRHVLETTPSGGTVWVRCTASPTELCIEVQGAQSGGRDPACTGEGPDTVELPVEPLAGRGPRAGFGLSLVKRIVLAHHGSLEVQVEGGLHRVSLPLVLDVAGQVPHADERPPQDARGL